MVHSQVAHGVHDDLSDESLHPVVVVEGGGEDVSPDVLVHGGILVQELLDGLPVNEHHLAARLVPVADVMVLEEAGKVLWVATVCTREGEENMEHSQVFQFGVEFKLVLAPIPVKETIINNKSNQQNGLNQNIPRSVLDVVKNLEATIPVFHCPVLTWLPGSTLHTNVDLISHLLQFNEGHRSIHKRETVCKSFVNISDALIKEHDVGKINLSVFVEVIFSSRI